MVSEENTADLSIAVVGRTCLGVGTVGAVGPWSSSCIHIFAVLQGTHNLCDCRAMGQVCKGASEHLEAAAGEAANKDDLLSRLTDINEASTARSPRREV